jgi:hypothetical protein
MARDPRKAGAFESGMRGKEKPKVESGNTGGERGARVPDGGTGSESRQAAGKTVGDAGGVDLSAYTSGMRGTEKPMQKSASGDANLFAEAGSKMGGESKQGPNTIVGHPKGHNDAGKGPRKGVDDGTLRSKAEDAYHMGNDGNAVNSSEEAAQGHEPSGEGILGEEDDTHINIRIPKASLKRKNPGMQGN